jgi:DNA-binding MarR family transcriptional regulator
MSTRSASLASVQAAGTDTTQQGRVVAFLREAGPAIKDRVADALGLRTSSVTARINELVKLGRVVEKDIVFNAATRRHVTLYAAAAAAAVVMALPAQAASFSVARAPSFSAPRITPVYRGPVVARPLPAPAPVVNKTVINRTTVVQQNVVQKSGGGFMSGVMSSLVGSVAGSYIGNKLAQPAPAPAPQAIDCTPRPDVIPNALCPKVEVK